MKNKHQGFTLIELMITIAIVGIMAAIAFPSMREFVLNTRITNRAEQISNLMRFAKTEAVRRNVPVIVCGTRIRSDGRPLGNCSAADLSKGMRAFADMDKNGAFDEKIDVNLRTVSINGNGSQQLAVIPTVYEISVSGGAVSPTSDTLSQFVFLPNGSLGRQTTAGSFNGMRTAQNYVRFQISEAAANGGNSANLSEAQKSRSLVVASNPSGKVITCRNSNKDSYEAPAVCQIG